MKKQFKEKSRRYRGYDYASEGAYFITINIKDRLPILSKIQNEQVVLTDIGKVIQQEWEKTAQIRKEIELGEYVIMPNHFHAVLFITPDDVGTQGIAFLPANGTNKSTYLPTPLKPEFKVQKKSLGAIVRGFKSACTIKIKHDLNQPDFQWQPNYHDRIIRNQQELINIENYILQNPPKWNEDEYFCL